MNKFEKLLSDNGSSTLLRRASIISSGAKIAQENIINGLKQSKLELQNELMSLTDLAPETTESLRPGSKDWDAKEWVTLIQNLKRELYDIDIQLEIAEETYNEYFVDAEQ